jgi:hypothetical protein
VRADRVRAVCELAPRDANDAPAGDLKRPVLRTVFFECLPWPWVAKPSHSTMRRCSGQRASSSPWSLSRLICGRGRQWASRRVRRRRSRMLVGGFGRSCGGCRGRVRSLESLAVRGTAAYSPRRSARRRPTATRCLMAQGRRRAQATASGSPRRADARRARRSAHRERRIWSVCQTRSATRSQHHDRGDPRVTDHQANATNPRRVYSDFVAMSSKYRATSSGRAGVTRLSCSIISSTSGAPVPRSASSAPSMS